MRRQPSDSPCPRFRLCAGFLSLVWVTALPAQSIDDELPLPRWDQEAPRMEMPPTAEPGQQFNSLLPADVPPPTSPTEPLGTLPSGPRLADAPPTLMPGYSQLGPTDLTLFLHGSILDSAQPPSSPRTPTPAMSLKDLPLAMLDSLRSAPANEYILDPQGLLPEMPRLDLERLLTFHASEARIRCYLLILGADQKLPAHADLSGLALGALIRQPSCLAVYPLGEPWRARLFLSTRVHQSGSHDELTEMAADCIQDAQKAEESAAQLQRFAVRLSTRLFWLEKSMTRADSTSDEAKTSLLEVAAHEEGNDTSAVSRSAFWQALALSLSGLALLMLLGLTLKKRSQRQRRDSGVVWMLPDLEVTPRLGGAFCGGASAVRSYKR